MQVSKIYQKALNNGGKILENKGVYTCKQSKYNPNRFIQRVVLPNGNYTIQISENGNVTKLIHKYILNETSSITDTWDFIKKQGIHLSTGCLNNGKSIISRAFDKVNEKNIKQDGFIYLYHFGKKDKYITEIRTLDGITSIPKPFSPLGWLNNKFYEIFNK